MENEAMEIMENVTEAIVENDTVRPIPCESADASLASKVIRTVILGAVIGVTLVLVKKDEIKERNTQRSIKKLTKKGYTVIRNEDLVDEACDDCEVETDD